MLIFPAQPSLAHIAHAVDARRPSCKHATYERSSHYANACRTSCGRQQVSERVCVCPVCDLCVCECVCAICNLFTRCLSNCLALSIDSCLAIAVTYPRAYTQLILRIHISTAGVPSCTLISQINYCYCLTCDCTMRKMLARL